MTYAFNKEDDAQDQAHWEHNGILPTFINHLENRVLQTNCVATVWVGSMISKDSFIQPCEQKVGDSNLH